MPSAQAFRKAWNLDKKGNTLQCDGHTLTLLYAQMGHDCIQTNQLYHFPFNFRFSVDPPTSTEKFTAVLKKLLQPQPKTVYSQYGSPYDCEFGALQIKTIEADKEYEVTGKGTGTRDRVSKTLSELSEEGMSAEDKANENALSKQLKQSGYKVMKSHFAGSKCKTCHAPIQFGSYIVNLPVGYSHVTCAPVQEAKEESASSGSKKASGRKKRAVQTSEESKEEEGTTRSARKKRSTAK